MQFLLLTFAGWVNRRQQGVIACLGEIAEADFFTVEVLSYVGLLRYYVLFVIDIQTRKVNIAGISHQPHGRWMEQIARNLTDAEEGFLGGMRSNCHEFRPQRCGRSQLLEISRKLDYVAKRWGRTGSLRGDSNGSIDEQALLASK